MTKMKLHKSWQSFTGHCQVTYTIKNSSNQRLVYCLQQFDHSTVRLMRCSQDGEPSHNATPREFIEFERPDRTDRLTELVNNWIDEHERNFKK